MTDPRPSDGFTVFQTARTPLEAELVASILRDAGIPAFVEGSMLADEFAVSQRLMNLNSIAVRVPTARVHDAQAALAAARAAAAADGATGEDAAAMLAAAPTPAPPPTRSGPGWLFSGLMTLLAIGFLVQWLDTRAQLRTLANSALTTATPDGAGAWRLQWRDNGAPAAYLVDNDADGTTEAHTTYNRRGQQLLTAFDGDQDGIHERVVLFAAAGETAAELLDEDQDGVAERAVEQRGATTVAFIDADQDRRTERIEMRGPAGELVRAWRWQDGVGFTPAE